MRVGTLARSAIIFVPLLLICVGRLHAQRSASPDGLTKEVNRCLTVMRVAASRRRNTGSAPSGRGRVAVRTDAAGGWAPSTRAARLG